MCSLDIYYGLHPLSHSNPSPTVFANGDSLPRTNATATSPLTLEVAGVSLSLTNSTTKSLGEFLLRMSDNKTINTALPIIELLCTAVIGATYAYFRTLLEEKDSIEEQYLCDKALVASVQSVSPADFQHRMHQASEELPDGLDDIWT